MKKSTLTDSQWDLWIEKRQRARTDLLFLCNDVLGYDWVNERVHRPIIDILQPLFGGVDTVDREKGTCVYSPNVEMWSLQNGDDNLRDFLILYPRGHLKTTLVTQAHAIQWIINYCNVRILISTATGDQADVVVPAIKAHFQYNEKFRWLFPEFCPSADRTRDFGNMGGFTVPNRVRAQKRESTVSVATIGKAIAGRHYDVIFHSDLVDKENVKTPGGIKDTKDHFTYTDPLLERSEIAPNRGWVYVEGTTYDFNDLHCDLAEQIENDAKEGRPRSWVYIKKPAEWIEKGERVTLWPEHFPPTELDRIKKKGEWMYAAQYLLHPIPSSGGLATEKDILFINHSHIRNILPRLRLHVTVDLHGMEDKASNDYTVITLAGFDDDGRMYVIDMRRGHFTPFEVIFNLFDLKSLYPKIEDYKIEKDAHARVLLPFLKREESKRKVFLTIVPLKRDNSTSKKHRIRGLQSWFKAHIILFSDNVTCKLDIIQEVLRFSNTSTYHDDILDTLTDQMQNRDGKAVDDVFARDKLPDNVIPFGVRARFMGFDPSNQGEMWSNEPFGTVDNFYHRGTGL